ncbi:LysR family transcriptional regulator [Pseudomonas sp. ACN5]|uniref:LysR family transcriptional regulator n=1 Tax=Pseudomonas sp. ACN5 TaxID=1920427 RepID=UPI000BB2EF45|nr:LysR family transcriptional regulator [Pseudomonas sp. ACN5]PBJ04748.1 HTH-type transcriptional regulator BenM [Pseudomonas sp. ACN5]
MDIRQIKRFIAVARTRNFTKAAQSLHVAQPSLSKQIHLLEEELGFQLFLRETRPIQLTPAGQRFYEDAIALVGKFEQMTANARQTALGTRQTFTIGFVASALYGALPTIIRRLRRVRPDLDVKWEEMTSGEQMVALRERKIDVGFGRIHTEAAEVDRIVLREERLMAAIAPAFELASISTPVSLAELGGWPIIVYPSRFHPSFADQVLNMIRAKGGEPSEVHAVGDLQTALGLASAESGYCIIPASARHLRRELVYRLVSDKEAVSPLIMSYRLDDNDSVVEVIKELTRTLYAEKPEWLEPEYNRILNF